MNTHSSLTMDSNNIPENINSSTNNSDVSTTTTTNNNILPSGAGCLSLSNDARLEFITSYTLTSLRLKHDKWHKMMATQEYQLILLDWLNNPQRRLLVMTLNPAGHLIPKNSINDLYQHNYATLMPKSITAAATTLANTTPTIAAAASTSFEEGTGIYENNIEVSPTSTSTVVAPAIATVAATAAMTAATALLAPLPPPSSSFSTLDGVPRGKCIYFVKRQLHTVLTRDNYRHEVMCGDFPIHSKIETLAILFDEILQPLLQNSLTRKQWPAVVGKDLQARMKDVRNTVMEIKGKTNNRTILSLLVSPTAIEEVASNIKQG